MPRIQAATVAEHRATQRRALLDAARSLLTESPDRAPSMAEVASRAGLSRSGVYQYFGSRDDLLDAVAEDAFPRWSAMVTEQMEHAGRPGERVLAYVDANLRLVAEGEHSLARALVASAPADRLAERSRVMHEQLLTPMRQALRELGAADPDATAELINAVVFAATRMIESGHDQAAARERARELLSPYLLA